MMREYYDSRRVRRLMILADRIDAAHIRIRESYRDVLGWKDDAVLRINLALKHGNDSHPHGIY